MTTDNTALKTGLTVVAALAAIPLAMMVLVVPTMGQFGGGHAVAGPGGWQMLFPLIPLAIVGGLVYLLYTGTTDRTNAGMDTRESKSARALDELRSAYARGDLSTQEYETRRETLRAGNSAAGDGDGSTRD